VAGTGLKSRDGVEAESADGHGLGAGDMPAPSAVGTGHEFHVADESERGGGGGFGGCKSGKHGGGPRLCYRRNRGWS